MSEKPTYQELEQRVWELEKAESERKQKEEALRENEAFIIAVLDNLPIGIAVNSVDPSVKFEYMNDNFPKCYRTSRAALADPDAFWNAVYEDPEFREAMKNRVLADCASGDSERMYWADVPITRKGAETSYITAGNTPVPNKQLMISTVWDVTKRKRVEKELRESEENLTITLNSIGDAVIATDTEGRVLRMNPIAENLTGWNLSEAKGQPLDEVFNIITEETRKRVESPVEKVLREGIVVGLTNNAVLISKHGTEYPIDDRESPIRDEQGKITGVVSVFRDVSEKCQAETALRKQAHSLSERVKELDCLHDISRIVERDSSFEEMFIEIANCIPSAWQYPEITCARILINDQNFETNNFNESSWNQACDITAHGKRAGVLEVFYLKQKPEIDEGPFLKEERNLVNSIAEMIGKIIERKVMGEKKRELETQLQQAQKMEAIGTLAGGIAHDFNNILGGIIGYAELARMKVPEGSNVIAYLDKMIKASDRAADLIKQILTLSRQHKQKQRPVQVTHIIKETLSLLRATLPSTIEIRQDLAKDAGVVNADPTQMHQVIMNLATNAGHAMQEAGGVLEVSLANVELDDLSVVKHLDLNAGSYLRLTVSDTGHGMTSEIMERIFDPYFTTKDMGEGTGLGLSVTHGIVKTHRGTITVYSEPRKGTTFHVYLPLILEEERDEKESVVPLPTGSERILFIDDDDALVEIGGQILEQLGYEVVPEKSSEQALEMFRKQPDQFDLVITDMTMPHLTGDKLAQELMTIRPNIPVILCTGHSRLVSEEKAEEIGIKAFVMKPLVMRNLAETVRKVLDTGGSLLY
jgi:PAS domain S-box-containing protein